MSVWDDLVGQEAAIGELSAAAAGQGMTHAWLITGPPGSGRSNAARAFAAALLTEDHGAGLSPEAQRALSGTHESMTMLRTQKSVISIDEVRQLVSTSQSSPVNADWRVIIIEDADRMAERTSNVLLKAIEEPPPTTVWILCAPSPEDVLTTIRSRCRTVGLRIPPAEAVAQLLVNRDGVDPERAKWAAAAAQNHLGRAKHLALDDDAAQARRRILEIPQRLTSVGATVRLAGRTVEAASERAEERTKARSEKERAELLETLGVEPGKAVPPALRPQVKKLEEEQKRRAVRARADELDSIMLELLSLYRDVLLTQLGSGDTLINISEAELIREIAAQDDATTTLKRINVLELARERLQTNTAPLLIVEAAFIGLANPWLETHTTR